MMNIVKRLKQEFSGNALKDVADQVRVYVKERHEAADKIERLQTALQECHDFIENYADVVDGNDGFPEPNQALALLGVINEALEGR